MSLETYKQKRNFNITSEPSAEEGKDSEAIFVIQKHAASHLHYDFRLALKGVLKSWAIPKGPCLDPKVKRLAIEVEDHPLAYAKFEGVIPAGEYGAGTVIVWDSGIWEGLGNVAHGYHRGAMHFILRGKKLTGAWKLIRMSKSTDKIRQWLLIKILDGASKKLKDYDIIKAEPNSILTGRSVDGF